MPLLTQSMAAPAVHQLLTTKAFSSAWVMLIGAPEPALIRALLTSERPVLIVAPDQAVLDALQEAWDGPWPEQLLVACELVGPEAIERPWYSYNDPRFNGLRSLEVLQVERPNLRLIQLELRQQCTLADLLSRWDVAQSAEGGMVLISSNDAVASLMTAGPTLRQLRWVGLLDCEVAAEQFDEALSEHWLIREQTADDPERLLCWGQDPNLVFQATVIAERDALITARDGLAAERDALTAQLASSSAERDSLIAERDALITARDGLAAERDGLQNKVADQEERLALINQELGEILAMIDASGLEQSEKTHNPQTETAEPTPLRSADATAAKAE